MNLEKNIKECGFDVVDMIPLRRQTWNLNYLSSNLPENGSQRNRHPVNLFLNALRLGAPACQVKPVSAGYNIAQ